MLPLAGIPKCKHNKNPGHWQPNISPYDFRNATPAKTKMKPENAHLENKNINPNHPQTINYWLPAVWCRKTAGWFRFHPSNSIILFWHSEFISTWVGNGQGYHLHSLPAAIPDDPIRQQKCDLHSVPGVLDSNGFPLATPKCWPPPFPKWSYMPISILCPYSKCHVNNDHNPDYLLYIGAYTAQLF